MIYSELKDKYQDFFKKFDIDEKTGIIKNKPSIKFPTFPYVGSKYGKSDKILIVGLDIGSDEKVGSFQSFEDRRKSIEDKPVSKHNPHIAGTYFIALYFLKYSLNLQDYWNELKNYSSCQKALQNQYKLPPVNPLSYIALTNYYKFVTINRKNTTGGENRKHIDEKAELTFFLDEVKIFNPDVIVFQSRSFKKNKKLLNRLSETRYPVYLSYHPSYRGKREPEYFINLIETLY